MQKTILALCCLCFSSLLFSQGAPQKLEELLTAYNNQDKFNGSILVTRRDTILLSKGYGFKNTQNNSQNTPATIYQIGSITKQFTSAVIMKLVELQKISLDDKLSKFYPGFPHGDSITIENLLTHTSGVFNYTDDEAFMKTEAVKPADEQKILALFKNKELGFQPGTKWNYSNSGYSLLGYIIQKVLKIPYEQAAKQYIFMPLNMNNTGFDFTHLSNPEKATGYWSISGTTGNEATIVDSSVSFSAGAIYSTTGDLYKWHRGLLNGRVIRPASLEKTLTPFKNNYGYGWNIDSIYNKRRISHGGGIFGFTSNITLIPEDDVCIVFLSNRNNTNFQEIAIRIIDIIYQKPYDLPKLKQEISLNEEILKKYPGTYEVSSQISLKITLENGALFAQPTGQSALRLLALTENHFFLKEIEIELEFGTDESGKVDKVTVYQGGQKILAKKVD